MPPSFLFRYRGLPNEHITERELLCLRNGYLFSPAFHEMNDPMEAFYEMGSTFDTAIDFYFDRSGMSADLYNIAAEEISKFAVISFSDSAQNFPLWAYYADNFKGFCLEFDTQKLMLGGLEAEYLHPVRYVSRPPPKLSLLEILRTDRSALTRHLYFKRQEWNHEKEWRLVTASRGAKSYTDDALTAVYVGPRASPKLADKICKTLRRRPTDIYQFKTTGYRMEKKLIQAATPIDLSERINGEPTPHPEFIETREEYEDFLVEGNFDDLSRICTDLAKHPNVTTVSVCISTSKPGSLRVWLQYAFRNGQICSEMRYLSNRLRFL